jgi:hypothetical protein
MSRRTWYPRLVARPGDSEDDKTPILTKDYKPEDLIGKLIIAYEGETKGFLYRVYDSYLDFIISFRQTRDDEKFFHEVTRGRIKMYFDFDISGNLLKRFDEAIFIDTVTTAVINVYKNEFNVTLKLDTDFIWLQSHKVDANTGEMMKRSYHLIIDNYYMRNHTESQYLSSKVKEYIPYQMHDFFDWQIYHINKNFRTFGSVKRGDPYRMMLPMLIWKYKDTVIEYKTRTSVDHEVVLMFEATLITQVYHCKLLPQKVGDATGGSSDKTEIDIDDKILDAVKKTIPEFDETYNIRGAANNKILLDRRAPSYCPKCDRIHDKENPEIRVVDVTSDHSGAEYGFFFYCRRAPKGHFLGSIVRHTGSTGLVTYTTREHHFNIDTLNNVKQKSRLEDKFRNQQVAAKKAMIAAGPMAF